MTHDSLRARSVAPVLKPDVSKSPDLKTGKVKSVVTLSHTATARRGDLQLSKVVLKSR
jgi:hypothetical protein